MEENWPDGLRDRLEKKKSELTTRLAGTGRVNVVLTAPRPGDRFQGASQAAR